MINMLSIIPTIIKNKIDLISELCEKGINIAEIHPIQMNNIIALFFIIDASIKNLNTLPSNNISHSGKTVNEKKLGQPSLCLLLSPITNCFVFCLTIINNCFLLITIIFPYYQFAPANSTGFKSV